VIVVNGVVFAVSNSPRRCSMRSTAPLARSCGIAGKR
jgi:hypothetical protein